MGLEVAGSSLSVPGFETLAESSTMNSVPTSGLLVGKYLVGFTVTGTIIDGEMVGM